jgi:lipoprotein-anchoring transpeptidase ErfK/SrfK
VYRTSSRSTLALAVLVAASACTFGSSDTPDSTASDSATSVESDVSFATDTLLGPNDVLVTPELRGDTAWRAAADTDRRRRHPDAPAAVVPRPAVLPDSETLAQLTPDRVNARANRPVLGGEGATVLRAQVLLDQAGFSPGAIDGSWGGNTSKAAYWYQDANNLPVSGFIDTATFARLEQAAANRPALARYTVTAEDLKGPFVKLPATAYGQAELECLCYESVKEALAERFHTTQELLAQLNRGVNMDSLTAGAQLWVPNVERPRVAQPKELARQQAAASRGPQAGGAAPDTARIIGTPQVARIVISKKGSYLQAWDAQGRIIAHFPSTLGGGYDPSPDGEFHVTRVAFDPDFHYNPKLYAEVADSKPDAYLKPGPNSPVGVVWMALSKPHYGIHGTASPSTIGYAASHGCVRLTNWDARWLAERTPNNTPVEFR